VTGQPSDVLSPSNGLQIPPKDAREAGFIRYNAMPSRIDPASGGVGGPTVWGFGTVNPNPLPNLAPSWNVAPAVVRRPPETRSSDAEPALPDARRQVHRPTQKAWRG
jgi:hypothetical protein